MGLELWLLKVLTRNALYYTHGGQNNHQYCESSLCEEHCSTEKKSFSTFKSKISHNPLAKIFTEAGEKSTHVSIRQ